MFPQGLWEQLFPQGLWEQLFPQGLWEQLFPQGLWEQLVNFVGTAVPTLWEQLFPQGLWEQLVYFVGTAVPTIIMGITGPISIIGIPDGNTLSASIMELTDNISDSW